VTKSVKLKIYSKKVEVGDRKINCVWTKELADDLAKIQPFDYNDEEIYKIIKREERTKKIKEIFDD